MTKYALQGISPPPKTNSPVLKGNLCNSIQDLGWIQPNITFVVPSDPMLSQLPRDVSA